MSEPEPRPAITTVTVRADSGRRCLLRPGRARSRQSLHRRRPGRGATGDAAFFRVVTDWHRVARGPADRRPIGRAITGAATWRFSSLCQRHLPLVAADLDGRQIEASPCSSGLRGQGPRFQLAQRHRILVGDSAALSFSAAPSSRIPWASDLVYRLVGEAPPARNARAEAPLDMAGRGGGEGRREAGRPAGTPDGGIDDVGPRRAPGRGMEEHRFRLPAAADAPVVFTIDRGNGRPQKRATLTLDRPDARIVDGSLSRAFPGPPAPTFLRFAHTGEVLGWLDRRLRDWCR